MPERAVRSITNDRRKRTRFAPIRSLSPAFTRVTPLCPKYALPSFSVPGNIHKTSMKKERAGQLAPHDTNPPDPIERNSGAHLTIP